MNYTIIGHTEDDSHTDRWGDYISRPGKFETFFFRDDERTGFIELWAKFLHDATYEDLIILLNGCPDNELGDEDDALYFALAAERDTHIEILKAKAAEAKKLIDERNAAERERKAVVAKETERLRDMQQLAALQRKLGL